MSPDDVLYRWEIRGARVSPLMGGEIKRVWRVDDGLVLREYPSFATPTCVERECRWLTALGRAVPEIPVPLPTVDGGLLAEADGHCYVLAPYVEGEPIDADSDSQRRSMAQTVARIQAAAIDLPMEDTSLHPPFRHFDWNSNPWWDLDRMSRLRVGQTLWADTLPRLDKLPEWLDALGGLPESLVHGDYGVVNVLARDDRVSGVIDWDMARIDWRITDLAHAIRTVADPDGTYDSGLAQEFLDDFREAGGVLTDPELALVPVMLRLQVTWVALYDLGRADRGELDEDSALYRCWNMQEVDRFASDLVLS